jgi:membrane protease YdiL (CAAX protease family)
VGESLDGRGVYPDGMPHPTAKERRRIALELAVLALLTGLFLGFQPIRPMALEVGMALVGMGLVGLLARQTSEQLWGVSTSPDFERMRRCATAMILLTLPPVIGFGVYGAVDAAVSAPEGSGFGGVLEAIATRLFRWHFFVTLLFYVPWALVQQMLFQFYLLARLRALLPYASPLFLACLNGFLYGAMHLPQWPVAIVTMVGGVVWSYSYHRDRYVWPIAVSHAVLASTFYYWACNSDLLGRFLDSLTWPMWF